MSEPEPAAGCFYTLDGNDCIVDWGGPAWGAFARDNGAPDLANERLLGDSIYAHVAGHFTQRFLREFFISARAAPAPLSRNYRCDSPRMKRLMEMRAAAVEGERLRVEHRLIAETVMAVEVAPRETRAIGRAEAVRCSMCNRLRRHDSEVWREPDAAGAQGALRVVHTVCQDCRSGLSAHAPLRPASPA